MSSNASSSHPNGSTSAGPSGSTHRNDRSDVVGGRMSSSERKRYRKERRRTDASTTTSKEKPAVDYGDFTTIPLSTDLLKPGLAAKLTNIASADEGASVAVAPPSSAVPSFKVGTLEMYKRFPEAYEAFMNRHDCSALQSYLLDDVIGRIIASASPPETQVNTDASTDRAPSLTENDSVGGTRDGPPPVKVADFGCGTGRIETMVAAHPAVQSIYAYDGESAMLPRCMLNTVRAAKVAGHRTGVRVLATGSSSSSPTGPTGEHVDFSFSSPPRPLTHETALSLVARPCTFQSLQAGFLSGTRHERCQLIVCAWSLSYLMRLQWGETRWHAAVNAVIHEFQQLLDTTSSDAAIVIIETLGNGTPTPTRTNTLTQHLEETFGFEQRWMRTDYTFADMEEATRMTRFFFGDKVAQQVGQGSGNSDAGSAGTQTKDASVVLMECTGVWTLWKPRGS